MRRVLLVVWLVAGCAFDERVAGEPVIQCTDTAACPGGYFCQASVGRCVRFLSPGLAPPALVGPAVVSPSLAARGASVRVQFQVSEPLARPPGVRAVYANGVSGEVTLLDLGSPSRTFTAELQPGPDAPEGAVRFFVDLVDEDGAEATDLDLGAAVLDFTPPALVRGSAALTLTPSATNQLSRVEAMNETTLAQLAFVVTEPLAAAPALSVSVDGGTQAFSVLYSGSTGTSHLFSLTLSSPAVPQGPASLQVALEDLAGNRAELPVELKAPGLVIDTEAPPLAGLSDGGVVQRRAPTGAAFRFNTRGTTVTGAPGATEPGATVIASPTPTSAELARTTAGASGEFELTLPADLGSVTLRVLDSAGNQSVAALVRQVSWFASLSGGTPGANNPNPHRAYSVRALGPTPEPPGAQEHYGSSGLDTAGGAALLTSGAANWRRIPRGATYAEVGEPTGARRTTFTWDPFRARVVAVEGPYTPQVSEWNGSGWQDVGATDPEGDGNPGSIQSSGGLAFDEDSRLLMLISSRSWNQRETWGWTGASWVFLGVDVTTPCTGCTLAWDSKRRRVLLFDPPTGTTAAWNSSARTWQRLAVSTTPSLLATWPALAFERHTGRWLRFGGFPVHDETWAFDGTNWTLVASGGPSPRWGALATYDPVSERVLLFGGSGKSDRWAWDGQRWELLADAGLPAGAGALVVAPALGQTLVNAYRSTLKLGVDGGFTQVADLSSSEAQTGLTGTYSSFHDAVLFTGAHVNTSGACNSVVRGLGAAGFIYLRQLPECRERGALAVDQRTGRLYHVGGLLRDGGPSDSLFVTDDAGAWRALDAGLRLPDGGSSPAARSEPIAWVDPAQDALVMVGGLEGRRGSAAAYTLTSGGWVSGGPTPPANSVGCLWGGSPMFVPDGGVLVEPGYTAPPQADCTLYGGSGTPALGATWAVGDAGLVSTAMASLRISHAPRSWDEGVGAWLSFGGTSEGYLSPLYEYGWDVLRAWWPNGWSTVPVADSDGDGSPGPRIRHAMGFVRGRQTTVLYGGESRGLPYDDAWELQLAGTRPALLFRVSLRDALARGATPVALVLEAVAGADDGDGGRPGISARVWHRQRWLDLGPVGSGDGGTALATAGQPGAFVLELQDPVLLHDLLEEPALTLALVPTEGFARSPPLLAVDFLELRLDSTFPEGGP